MGDEVDGEKLIEDIQEAMSGDSDANMLWFTDRRGKRIGVVTERLAYVEVGATGEQRHVGFSAV